MLASSNSPAPVKPKKKVAKPKVPKPSVPKPAAPKPAVTKPTTTTTPKATVPKPATTSTANTTTPITKTSAPKQVRTDFIPLRSEPIGSNKQIVIPPPVNFYISPSTAPISSPHIPERKQFTPTNNVERNITMPKLNQTIARDTTPKNTYATNHLASTTAPIAKATLNSETKGKPAKKAKLSLDDEKDSGNIKEGKTKGTSETPNTTRARTTSTRGRGRGRGRGKMATNSTRPVASTTEPKQQGKKRTIETDDEDESLQKKEPKSRRHQQPLPILSK